MSRAPSLDAQEEEAALRSPRSPQGAFLAFFFSSPSPASQNPLPLYPLSPSEGAPSSKLLGSRFAPEMITATRSPSRGG